MEGSSTTIEDDGIPESVARKLDRAREHVCNLTAEVSEYVDECLAARREVENDGKDHLLVWDRFSLFPARLALIIGDAVHNLRSALDHLVVALVKAGAASSGAGLAEEEERVLQYPVCATEDSFKAAVLRRRLRHVPSAAVDYIRGMLANTA
ncbi:hypothetical protein [Paenarthrobacter sp. PH39-S1]|uniref:hypothetical protein n=1 Tax=Paenarthrobacter sp. PH39-S1 TaxID=3046204 RepID=UPI0024B98205|nr:hypothetical protein [Paenarthrobacter sp. PH39-S1]MDJ0358578.1 hypothetical protein [Paenarthrobacter sp. PH39-S1]